MRQLRLSCDPHDLLAAEQFVLLLNTATWTSAGADALAREVSTAIKYGVDVLLLHEHMPLWVGVGGQEEDSADNVGQELKRWRRGH